MQLNSLTAHTGTEVLDLDLRQPLDDTRRGQLLDEFARRSVLVFRDQQLTPDALLGAVQNFGEVFEQQNTRFSLPECPLIHYLSNEDRFPDGTRYIPGSGYHTDHSNEPAPPKATVLYAVELPTYGGDTQFANMHVALEALPERLRGQIDGQMASHVYQSTLSQRKLMTLTADRQARIKPSVHHPVVRTHPETGRQSIYINPIRIQQIGNLDESGTRTLMDDLVAHATQTEFEYRHQWRKGDMVMWDNRCLLHKANGDYDMSERRYMYRVMLQGTPPV
ncbi:MAG: TauD/TfdA family dioxygenase [Pseudomonadota bacterium]